MTLRLTSDILTLHTRHPFIIARGGQSEYRTLLVTITDADGVTGWGEAAATRFYGETCETVVAALATYAPLLGDDPLRARRDRDAARGGAEAERRGAGRDFGRAARPRGEAGRPAAVEATGDWTARAGAALDVHHRHRHARGGAHQGARGGRAYPDPQGEARHGGRLGDPAHACATTTDRRSGWTRTRAGPRRRPSPAAAPRGVRGRADRAAGGAGRPRGPGGGPPPRAHPHHRRRKLRTAADIPRLAGAVDGINIKLAKCGSLREALRMVAVARAHQLR